MFILRNGLKEVLSYDPETGVFTWLVSNTNSVKVGDIAGSLSNGGYIRIRIDGRYYYAHRLAFLYMTGKFPKDQTDHINHVRDDNRWENLREADRALNRRNQSMSRRNTSGHVGVHWDKARMKWMAHICINGKRKNLGRYLNIQDAIIVRKAAHIKYGFHENHGSDGTTCSTYGTATYCN